MEESCYLSITPISVLAFDNLATINYKLNQVKLLFEMN